MYFREAEDIDTLLGTEIQFLKSSQFKDTVETDYLQTIAIDNITDENGAGNLLGIAQMGYF